MDYSSDIDLDDPGARQRRQGGVSFLIALIGTACLVAAWIMSSGDPYGDLANRVVEVRAPDSGPPVAAGGPGGLQAEDAAAREGPVGLLPDALGIAPDAPATDAPTSDTTATDAADTGTAEDAFRQAIGSLPRAGGSHPAEIDRTAALAPAETAPAAHGTDPAEAADATSVGVPVEEFAAPPADAGAVDLTRAERRAVQRRLGMAGHAAGGTDGVFGPMTRAAIVSYQQEAGLAPTGEIDKATLSALRAETDAEYAAWAETRRTASSRSARAAAAESLSEEETPVAPGDCARDADGNIVGGGLGCSLRGFGDGLRETFGGGQHGSAGFQPGSDR